MAIDNQLEVLRGELRKIDDNLMQVVCLRFDVIRKIGAIKLARGLSIQDHQQESSNKAANQQVVAGRVPAEFVDELTDLLAKWSRHIQSQQR